MDTPICPVYPPYPFPLPRPYWYGPIVYLPLPAVQPVLRVRPL